MPPSIRSLQDDAEFSGLSPEAKGLVFDRLAGQDTEFRSLSPEAQGLVRSRLLGTAPSASATSGGFLEGAKHVATGVAERFGLTGPGPLETATRLVTENVPAAVRVADIPLKILAAPAMGLGLAARDVVELGGAGVAR